MYRDNRPLLMVGETYHTADLYYVVGFLFGDAVVFLDKGDGDSLLVCGDFERAPAAEASKAARVRGFQDYGKSELAELPDHEQLAALTLRVLRREGVDRVVTTDAIPLSVADHLRASGVDVLSVPDLLQGPREVKGSAEIAAIEVAQRATEQAMGAAVDLVSEARVGHDGLLYHGAIALTSERLRAAINAVLLEAGCYAEGTIAASGADAAQPHNTGSGPIHAGRPIVLDIFPRHEEHRYFADMTRTISKGTPRHEITRMYEVTRAALALALGLIGPRANGRDVFEAVCRHYEDHGYATYLRNGDFPEEGFIHSLGHGVGLDIHEGPLLGRRDEMLQEGHVITVEPGLYVPGLGGVRIEDMVLVTADGYRNLTDFPDTMVIA